MLQTFSVDHAVELAVVDRNGFIESRHSGAVVVLAPNGEVLSSHGDVNALIMPRSSMKPMQALASITAGATLAGEHLAMSTASHSGTDRHAAVVADMLASGGLSASDLECPPAWPADTQTRDDMVRRGEGPSPLRMACSGKHAAMLLACRASGWPTVGYTTSAHPLQVHIREVVERFIGEKVAATAIDGCGAPVYAMTMLGLARGLQRIGTASARSPFALFRSAGELIAAVKENPWTIEGTGRRDTVAIETLNVFAKFGAEGIMTMVAPDGTTVVSKTLDGCLRVGPIVAASLLLQAGAISAEQYAAAEAGFDLGVHGGGEIVGRVRPTVTL